MSEEQITKGTNERPKVLENSGVVVTKEFTLEQLSELELTKEWTRVSFQIDQLVLASSIRYQLQNDHISTAEANRRCEVIFRQIEELENQANDIIEKFKKDQQYFTTAYAFSSQLGKLAAIKAEYEIFSEELQKKGTSVGFRLNTKNSPTAEDIFLLLSGLLAKGWLDEMPTNAELTTLFLSGAEQAFALKTYNSLPKSYYEQRVIDFQEGIFLQENPSKRVGIDEEQREILEFLESFPAPKLRKNTAKNTQKSEKTPKKRERTQKIKN